MGWRFRDRRRPCVGVGAADGGDGRAPAAGLRPPTGQPRAVLRPLPRQSPADRRRLFSLGLYLTAAVVALRIAERPPALAASAGAGALLWLAAVDHRWTYLWESRYYAPFLLLLVPLAFALAGSPRTDGSAALVLGARVTVGAAPWSTPWHSRSGSSGRWSGDMTCRALRSRSRPRSIRVAHKMRRLAGSEGRPVVLTFPSMGEASRRVACATSTSEQCARRGRWCCWCSYPPTAPTRRASRPAGQRPGASASHRPTKVLYRVDVEPTR
jgi:hypothetical protein